MIEIFQKGGFLMYPLLGCSLLGVAIVISKFIEYQYYLKILNKPLQEILKTNPTILLPVVEKIKEGCGEEELTVVCAKQVSQIEKGLSWLTLIATIAPLLGLTGTVTGMIKAFKVVSENPTINPSLLAGGIWEALITTAAGLLIAVPIYVAHHYLDRQADEIVLLLKEFTMTLRRREQGATGKKAPELMGY